MYFVYFLQSLKNPKQTYIGYTTNIENRIASHNSGGSTHTAKFRPWKLIWYSAFLNENEAIEFEIYLKSSSGKAFAVKRLLPKSTSQPIL